MRGATTSVEAKHDPGSDKRHVWNEWRKIATGTLVRLGGELLSDQLPAIKLEGNAAPVERVEEAIEAPRTLIAYARA
jgi:hypothetical protein